MTSEQLIAEGRKLERPTFFLLPHGEGPVVARWYDADWDEIDSTGLRRWLTVDTRCIPGLPSSVPHFVDVFTDEVEYQSGSVQILDLWPDRPGTDLYLHPASVLPPLDAVFARGSDAVEEWIGRYGWTRAIRHNNNFRDREPVNAYEEIFCAESPFYKENDIYAIIGGWHMPGPEDGWHDLIDEHLMLTTLRDSEPWVEAWYLRNGEFKVDQRIT